MAKSMVLEVVDRVSLSDAEVAQVRKLAAASQAAGYGESRLVWDGLSISDGGRPKQFLAYQAGRLVGFLSVEGLGEAEAEATGLLDPTAAAGPIVARLIAAARGACRAGGSGALLVAIDQRAQPAAEALVALGAAREFGEHKLAWPNSGAPALPDSDLQIAGAGPADAAEIAAILSHDMSIDPAGFVPHIENNMRKPNYHYYIARAGGTAAGTANVQQLNGEAYIYGLVVRPEYRGRGYGRQLMLRMLADHAAGSDQPMYIEVETENTPAHTLYRSLGFAHVATFDYFRVELTP